MSAAKVAAATGTTLEQAKAALDAVAKGDVPDAGLDALPARAYFDSTVSALLLDGLTALAKERPPDPVDFLAYFLLQNNPRRVADRGEKAKAVSAGKPKSGTGSS